MTTPTRSHRLSKSRFVAGCQCHKLLWWRVHEPNAEELQPDIVLQDRFDQGQEVEWRIQSGFRTGYPRRAPCRRPSGSTNRSNAGARKKANSQPAL